MQQRSDRQVCRTRAAVLHRMGGPLPIETLEMEGSLDDEVPVRITVSGICHTDIDFCKEWDGAAVPVVLEHEGAGVVESTRP